jgi:hypothetical protein
MRIVEFYRARFKDFTIPMTVPTTAAAQEAWKATDTLGADCLVCEVPVIVFAALPPSIWATVSVTTWAAGVLFVT